MEYMANCEDNFFDLAIVDPPYGIGVNMNIGRRKNDIKKHDKKKWDSNPPNQEYFKELFRVSKKRIIWGANNFAGLPVSNGWIVWDKQISGNVDFSECELAFCDVKKNVKKFTYRAQSGENYSVKIHPTQKPVPLYKWLLKNYAKPGQKILDTHLGSGSSAIAAHYFGCDFVGCEIDKDYFEAATQRFKKETAQLSLLGLMT